MFTLNKKNLEEYLTERPDVTFNKEVYKQHTAITNVNHSYKLQTIDGFKYQSDNLVNIKDSYVNEIDLYIKNDDEILVIDDICSIEMSIVSENTTSILHKYSGSTLKAILLATNNTNKYKINLPLVKSFFSNIFVRNGYKLILTVNLNKFNIDLYALVNYIQMFDQNELSELDKTCPRRLIRHIIDEYFIIEKGLNIFKLSPQNMQCCLIFFTFSPNIQNINATLKIGENEHCINKYYSNYQFEGLNNNQNIMIFDIYKNVNEFYNTQPMGNILLDEKVTLSIDSSEIGSVVVGYVLLDLIMYNQFKIKFFDMPTENISVTAKPPNIKHITIYK